MKSPVQNILQHLFQTDSLQNVSVEQIQHLIDSQPYYDAAYFLLAKKLKTSNENGYEQAIQSAALHFSNELWLNYKLNEDVETEVEQPQSNFIQTEEVATITQPEEIEEKVEEEIPSEINIVETQPVEIIHQPEVETTSEDNEAADYDEEIDNVDENYTEAEFPVNEKLSNLLKEQAAELNKPVEESAAAEIPIENTPYHRVDYFDSQGIKLEDKQDDKLGKRLLRFTDWLKHMKKANPNPVNLDTDEKGEKEVENIAQHSNEKEEVVTETMAEVLIKQGKPEQAIEIYEKLSFINPSKSSYFAAQIRELKKD